MTSSHVVEAAGIDITCAVVLRVEEHSLRVRRSGSSRTVPFAPQFPSPRTERVSPGHLVAVATDRSGRRAVVWRWYDAVVLEADGADEDGVLRLWEPAHGEVVAAARPPVPRLEPGSRAYASAGLPGADWWVAAPVSTAPEDAQVDLAEVADLYSSHGLWPEVFAPGG